MNEAIRPSEDDLLKRRDVADILQVTERTLINLEHTNKAPPHFWVGRSVRYPRSWLDEYLLAQKAVS